MGACSQLPTQAQAVALYWDAHLEAACVGLPGKDRYIGVVCVRPTTTSKTMLNQHVMIFLATVLLLFSSADKSRMAGNYWQTLPVVGEV